MTEGRAGARLKLLAFLVLLMFSALTVRLWYLQVLASEQLAREANENRLRFVDTPATRGWILDANGIPLVKNRRSLQVTVTEDQLGDDADAVLARLARLLQIRRSRIRARLEDPKYYDYQPVPVAVDVKQKVYAYVKEFGSELQGVGVQEVPVRTYPEGRLAAHLLGYTGQISAAELDDRRFDEYEPSDEIGRAGLEQVYEKYLRGDKGTVKYQVNAAGESLGQFGRAELPTPGNNLVLSLDAGIQHAATESLRLGMLAARGVVDEDNRSRFLEANAGAVIVMDPHDGAIKAMASLPDFDPSIYIGGSSKRIEKLQEDERTPLFNRASEGGYPPGSTFKPFVALSSVRSGIASLAGSYDCPATYHVPKDPTTVFNNWSASSLGILSVAGALEHSCDTVFYDWGYQFYLRDDPVNHANPPEPLQRDLRQFGFGRRTDLDLPSQAVGNIPDDDWIDAQNTRNDFLFPGDYIQMSIGQGSVLVTPLQLATAYSMIANGGTCVVPHIADKIQTPDGDEVVKNIDPECPRERRTLPYSDAQLDYVRQALVGVVSGNGTATSAWSGFDFGQVSVAGKTGTAEREGFQNDSWFAAMAGPANDPDYVVAAVVEQGGHGSTTAAPIVRRVVEYLYGMPTADEITTEVATD